MPDKPTKEFGKRRPVAIPAAQPVKRSGHVALLLMGTFALGGGAYALMPRECTPASPGMTPGVSTPGECPPRGSSSSGSGGGSSRYSYYSGGSSGSTPAASSDAGSGGVKRGGFGAFAHSFASHFSFGG